MMASTSSSSLFSLALLMTPFTLATSAPSSLPQVDFSRMGQVGLGGSFAGLDWWSPNSSFASASTSTKFSSVGDTLFMQNADGTFTALGSTNSGGVITSVCWSNSAVTSSDSASNGTLYVGGWFSSLSSTASTNVVAYSLSSQSFHPLSSGLPGTVNAAYCDDADGQVWFGGSFPTSSGQTMENVAVWNTKAQAWTSVPFGGLNGAVDTIGQGSSDLSIVFGGSFTTTFSGGNSTSTNSSSSSAPSAPANVTTAGLSGYLTPVTLPGASAASGNLTITAGPSTSQAQYSDPEVLLCPGSGTYLGQDGSVTQVEILGYNYLQAAGARVFNSHIEGRSATMFCITSLPDNTQLNMTYTDPTTGKNETCWEHCPLSSDPTVGGQDFVFTDGPRSLTGLQLQLKEWTGDGPGLSGLQLLSEGAYVSASKTANAGRCSGTKASSVQQTGQWTEMTSPTDIAGTVLPYITTSIPIANPTYPSVTFYPYVSSSGYYDVYMVIPGCAGVGDCAGRTSVDVEVFPKADGLGWTSTISEQVDANTETLIYSGWVEATTDSFSATISLALAKSPPAPQNGIDYVVVAQAVELVLTGVNQNGQVVGSPGAGYNGTIVSSSSELGSKSTAFGVFEYVRSATYNNISAAAATLSNSTETSLTQLGFALETAANTSTGSSTAQVNAIVFYNGISYVAGSFISPNNYSNVISVSASGQGIALASQGLDGAVQAAAVIGSNIFFGGAFTGTAQSSTNLQYIAQLDPKANTWSALGGGVDGPVLSLAQSPTSSSQLIVTGNFSHVLDSQGGRTSTGGMAVWDASKSAWMTSGGVLGNVTGVATSSSNAFFGGKVVGVTNNAVDGIAMLSTSKDGAATISPLTGATFGSTGSAAAPSGSSGPSRRALNAHRTRSLYSRFTDVVKGARPILNQRATAPTIAQQDHEAPAILAGGFWTNSSASNKPLVTIFGGNFTSGSGSNEIEGLAFYANGQLTGTSPSVTGVVRTVAVIGNQAWIGGAGVNVTGVGAGMTVYDLATSKWQTGQIPSLNAASGSSLSVNSIREQPNSNTVVVAGSFASAGSLTCPAICLWSTSNTQWSSPGSALTSGEVRAIDFAGPNSDMLVVAGSFVLNGAVSYAAIYSFPNSTWTDMPGLPGPALSIAVDDKDPNIVFAAGYSSSDASAYLQEWNGQKWTAQNSSLQAGSTVQQLAFVPTLNEHTATGSIEADRLLMVSGELYLENVGNVSSALYDGSTWYPYLIAQTADGGLGSVSSLFWSASSFSFSVHHYLARGLVVLVAIAIATGLILLLILLGLLYAYVRRQIENRNAPPPETYEKEGSIVSSTHQDVFNSVQAALEQSLATGAVGGGGGGHGTNAAGFGAGAGTAAAATGGVAGAAAARSRQSEDSAYHSASGAPFEHSDADEDSEDEGRLTHMRYDFDGPELQPGEMSMKAGQAVLVLDEQASSEWFYARDPATGREGVVPASYIW